MHTRIENRLHPIVFTAVTLVIGSVFLRSRLSTNVDEHRVPRPIGAGLRHAFASLNRRSQGTSAGNSQASGRRARWMNDATFAHLFAIANAPPGAKYHPGEPRRLASCRYRRVARRDAEHDGSVVPAGLRCSAGRVMRWSQNPWVARLKAGLSPLALGLILASGVSMMRIADQWLAATISVATAGFVVFSAPDPLWALATGSVAAMAALHAGLIRCPRGARPGIRANQRYLHRSDAFALPPGPLAGGDDGPPGFEQLGRSPGWDAVCQPSPDPARPKARNICTRGDSQIQCGRPAVLVHTRPGRASTIRLSPFSIAVAQAHPLAFLQKKSTGSTIALSTDHCCRRSLAAFPL